MKLRAALVLACAVAMTPAPSAQKPVDADALMERVYDYVARFAAEYGNIVADERYFQTVDRLTGGQLETREIFSELVLYHPEDANEWYELRDVVEVDGRRIRSSSARLTDALLATPAAERADLVRQALETGARHNIGDLDREANLPLMALGFLQEPYRSRFDFNAAAAKPNASEVVVNFKEIGRPTIIRGSRDADLPTHGRLWIDVRTGALRKSELKYEGLAAFSTVTTTFRTDRAFGVLVPSEMVEEHRTPESGRISGRASYSKFRRFADAAGRRRP